jgi:4-hydroxy-tetrahydrodipicolinate synthase/4-hydroxy-tetrahydrodipicolinate reductase
MHHEKARHMSLRFEGTFTALVTPFKDDLSIDWDAFDKLVEGQVAGGVQGIVPCGTTGESPALDHEEQLELVKRCVKLAKGKCIVLAGTGTNSTRSTINGSQAAARAGADAVMVVVPYYNKPTQEGLRQHYLEVAAAVDVPVVVYNIPGRTGIDLTTDTLARICEKAPNVVAVKEATGNVLRAQEIVRTIGSRISVLSGDDALTLPMISIGARGVISVTSNLYPAEVAKTTRLALDGKWDDARRARHDVRRGEPLAGEGGARAPGPDERRRPRPARTGVGAGTSQGPGGSQDVRGPVSTRVAVLGANGRMGRAVVRLAHEAGMKVVAAIGSGDEGKDAGELAGIGAIGTRLTSDLGAIASSGADVLVDFSAPAVLARACDECVKGKVAIASGTTGLDEAGKAALDAAAAHVPVLWEPNMSVGIHVLSALLERAVTALGEGYDIEIVETHHRMKVDAPSGTALRLAEVAKAARRASSGNEPRFVTGREGKPGARAPEEIGVLAMRGGDVIGDHTAFLFGDGERIELTHRASGRDLFARGALRAGRWLVGRAPGRYRLGDVLG